MDNRGFQKEPERDIRIPMNETAAAPTATAYPHPHSHPHPVATTSTATSTSAVKVCRPEICRRARRKYTQSRETSESPWHRKKTIFLITFIVLLGCWAIVYGILSHLGILWRRKWRMRERVQLFDVVRTSFVDLTSKFKCRRQIRYYFRYILFFYCLFVYFVKIFEIYTLFLATLLLSCVIVFLFVDN